VDCDSLMPDRLNHKSMLLALPPQTEPDTGSFPQDRDAVRAWLSDLAPVSAADDATELLRGLRHSNRLTNETENRRAILEEFRPTLSELIQSLTETITPQPLPMAASFRHASTLLDELLREEACAWKILLAHSAIPKLEDASQALSALAKQAIAAVQQYRRVPSNCLRDAHQIYALAASEGLFETNGLHDSQLDSINAPLDAYATVLVLATIDLRQIRVRQLALTLDFITEHLSKVRLSRSAPEQAWRETDRVLNLDDSHVPVPAASYLGDFSHKGVRWLDLAPLARAVDDRRARTRTTLAMTLGSDMLERQTLTRVSHALATNRARKVSRCISHTVKTLSFGHQLIANQLIHAIVPDDSADSPPIASAEWVQINHTPQGAAYRCLNADIGSVNGVVPVQLTRQGVDKGVIDEALIIACRINRKVTQTILLPGYRFQTGDRVMATQAERSKQLKLAQCLQSNGLFSQFVLAEG